MKQLPKMYSNSDKAFSLLKRSAPTILTCLSAVGMVATTVMAVRATPRVIELLEEAESEVSEKEEKLTRFESLKVALPVYIPTILIGISTISCMFGANLLSQKQQASYISAYTLLDNAFREYKNKVTAMFGEDADECVRAALINEKSNNVDISNSDEKLVFYEENYGEFFEMSKEEVLMAEYELNRNFILKGEVNLNEFYQFLGLPKTKIGEVLGWSLWAGEAFYGYSWIDFEHKKHVLDDGLEYYIISMPFPPTADYMNVF